MSLYKQFLITLLSIKGVGAKTASLVLENYRDEIALLCKDEAFGDLSYGENNTIVKLSTAIYNMMKDLKGRNLLKGKCPVYMTSDSFPLLATATEASASLTTASLAISTETTEATEASEASVTHFDQAAIRASGIIKTCSKYNIAIISHDQTGFPEQFRTIKQPPFLIYTVGNTGLMHKKKKIAIVGTRKPSEKAVSVAEKIAVACAVRGITVVSGLAAGIDTAAHKATILNGGDTIAILPSPVNEIFPRENAGFAKRIIEKKGLLLSEYPPSHKLDKSCFIMRDRLQSALADAVIVIEAASNDGTMHTAGFATEQNKRLAAIIYKDMDAVRHGGNMELTESGRAIPIMNMDAFDLFLSSIWK